MTALYAKQRAKQANFAGSTRPSARSWRCLLSEQIAIQQAFGVVAGDLPQKVEVPTFTDWFKGRFWDEWVVGRKNKPTEVRSKNIIFDLHLKPRFARDATR